MTSESSAKRTRTLHLIAGLLVFTSMTLALGKIGEDVYNNQPLTITDVRFSNWLHANGSVSLTKAMWIITSLHDSPVVSVAAVLISLFLWRRRERYWALALLLSVSGGLLLNNILKLVFHRARPQFDEPLMMVTTYSFPSGHTMNATVFYGTLTAFVFAKSKNWPLRITAAALAITLIVLVAFSRVYLGAHYLSDVLGAMAEGLAWIALSSTALYYFWKGDASN